MMSPVWLYYMCRALRTESQQSQHTQPQTSDLHAFFGKDAGAEAGNNSEKGAASEGFARAWE